MVPTIESIYVALWALFTGNAAIVAMFPTMGRWLRPYPQVPGGSAAMPALYLVEHPGGDVVHAGRGISSMWTLRCHLVAYLYTPNAATGVLPATLCNNAIDAIRDVLEVNPTPSNTQTLGGLVEHVYIEGAVEVAEGILQETSVVTLPVTILIPS